MSTDLTPRQIQLLKAIIEEFIHSGEAVGSISLQNKYKFRVSPATIRNEMAELVDLGYLYMKHSSGGRIPTTKAWRFFVSDLLKNQEEANIDLLVQEQLKVRLNRIKFETESLIREGLTFLHKLTGNTALALVNRDIYYAGLSGMIDIPEFHEKKKLAAILTVLEDYSLLSDLFNKDSSNEDIKILIGEEAEMDLFNDYAVVFTELRVFDARKGFIAVIGPNRLNYSEVIPAVKYISDTIKNLISGWN